ncbi:MAG: isoprenylcysteine carboxylmethyltransferase family protein [Thermovirgaceae bacterium]|nr:isoprenylcysteine carboxylmethyltransferase family protein [Thermovirgaceae bacterium]
MNDTSPGALAFRFRGGVWTLFFLAVLLLSDPGRAIILPGFLLVTSGQAVRFWAAGTITKYRGEKVGAHNLVTWGPYALARNPLYVGNALIGVGWCLLSGSVLAFALFAAVFYALYVRLVIPFEESFLTVKFPEDFVGYSKKVGRFFPLAVPEKSRIFGPFDPLILWRSERHSLWVTIIGTLLILSRRWW